MAWKQVALQEEFAQFSSLSIAETGLGSVDISEIGIQLTGTATVFDDLTADITRAKTVGTRVLFDNTENTVYYTDQSTTGDYLTAVFQLKHGWKIGSNIFPHIHFWQIERNVPNFYFAYRWQKNGQPKTTSWTSVPCIQETFLHPGDTTVLNQILYTPPVIPPAGATLSDILQVRLVRDNANTSGLFTGPDTYTGNASITSLDIRIELDTLGSNTGYEK